MGLGQWLAPFFLDHPHTLRCISIDDLKDDLFWVESKSNTYLKDRTTLDVLPRDHVGSVNVSLPSILHI